MGIHKDSCMDASCQGCNVQTAPASPPPQMVMMAMPQSPPLSPTGSTVELLEHEVSKGDWKGADNVCCCCEKGGNKLTLTDKRVIVKYWENCMPGCCESSMQEESFDYEDVVHVKVESGRSMLYGLVGAALCIGGVVTLIQHIVEGVSGDSDEITSDGVMMPIVLLVIGGLILTYWASGNSKAFVQLDFTKDKEVGSFQPALISYDTIMNPCNLFSCLGKLRRHVTRELKFAKKDAFAASSKICAIRQGLKEKLHGINKV
jgi:hypothetical protein